MHLIEDHAEKVRIPVRFAASKVMEGDTKILEQLKLTANEQHVLEEIAKQTEEETGMDRAAAVARCVLIYRGYLRRDCHQTQGKQGEGKKQKSR